MSTIQTNGVGAAGNMTVVQLDGEEREVLRELVDSAATEVVAGVLDVTTPEELDAAIVEVRHRSRLLRAVEEGLLTLDARTVDIIRQGRDETVEALELDRLTLARVRAGALDRRMGFLELTRADAERNVLRHIDRLLDELTIYDQLLSWSARRAGPLHP
jgi:hypothetical protein